MARVKIGNVFPPSEYLLKHCAPAGYGLGANITRLPDYTLLDITTSGFYSIDGSIGEKVPVDENYFWYSNMLKIGAFQFLHGTNTNSMVVRNNFTGTEEWVNPPMEVGVEYRTTERWMGKPVYTSLVNAGAYPETGLRNAETGIVATGIVRFHASAGYASLPRAGSMEINTFHNNGKLIVQLNTTGERINNNDVYVTLYYIKN
jgi:hypothetical protein